MELSARESGPVAAPVIVFLHGGFASGWSWQPVVERMQRRYRCVVPDLPQYGQSARQGPFEMGCAAEAVAELIRSRAGVAGRAHVVGFSLGAQVGVQLMAGEPDLVDRAVLCGTPVNRMPAAKVTHFLLRRLIRTRGVQWAIKLHWSNRHARLPFPNTDGYREDARRMTGAQLAFIVMASTGFTVPAELEQSATPALFLTGAKELPFTRRWAAALAEPMPNGVNGVVTGMRHDWPLRHPGLFTRVVDSWLSQRILPEQVRVLNPNRPVWAGRISP